MTDTATHVANDNGDVVVVKSKRAIRREATRKESKRVRKARVRLLARQKAFDENNATDRGFRRPGSNKR